MGEGRPARERRRIERRTAGWRQALSLLRGRDPLGPWAAWVPAEPGDAILFDPRILHSGSFIRGLKHSVFLAYGVPGRHFTRHRRYYREVRRELGYRVLEPALVDRLRAAGLFAPEEEEEVLPQAYVPSRLHTLLGRAVRPRVDP